MVDLDAGRRLPWPAQPEGSFRVVEREVPLNAERLAALRDLVESNASPELGDVLLADARFVADTAEPPDPSRALLIVAVACEVKIKSFLRASANRDQAPLLELLLSHPRDWSLAAAALFDKPLKIVAGRSLKDEPGDLWKRIDKLFQRRNALAHRGKRPTERRGSRSDLGEQRSVCVVEVARSVRRLGEGGPARQGPRRLPARGRRRASQPVGCWASARLDVTSPRTSPGLLRNAESPGNTRDPEYRYRDSNCPTGLSLRNA